MTDIFHAIADPTRRALLDELTAHDGQTLFELCGRLAERHDITSSRQAVSQHVRVLEQAGLVTRTRDGRTTRHWVDTAPLSAVVDRWPTPGRDQ